MRVGVNEGEGVDEWWWMRVGVNEREGVDEGWGWFWWIIIIGLH